MATERIAVLAGGHGLPGSAQRGLERLGAVEMHRGDTADAVLSDASVDLVVVTADAPVLANGGGIRAVLDRSAGKGILVLADAAPGTEAEAALGAPHVDWLSPPHEAATVASAGRRVMAARDLQQDNAHLRETVSMIESCSRMVRCLDAATVYAVALDLLLLGLGQARGFAHFHQDAAVARDGMLFRGFSREESRQLRQLLAASSPAELSALDRGEIERHEALIGLLQELGIHAPGEGLAVPLATEERDAGVVYVFGDEASFDPPALERAHIIAEQARIGLENADRYQSAKARALIDDATGLYNVRYLMDATDHELERATRYQLELSMLFVDIDRFKDVNDVHGHLVGSATLRHVAQVLAGCLRQIDTLARYGGDEFAILLTDTSPSAARAAAERIRRSIADTGYEDESGRRVAVTVSVGIACYPHDTREREGLIDLADKAMYRAKSQGRNQVVLSQDMN